MLYQLVNSSFYLFQFGNNILYSPRDCGFAFSTRSIKKSFLREGGSPLGNFSGKAYYTSQEAFLCISTFSDLMAYQGLNRDSVDPMLVVSEIY